MFAASSPGCSVFADSVRNYSLDQFDRQRLVYWELYGAFALFESFELVFEGF